MRYVGYLERIFYIALWVGAAAFILAASAASAQTYPPGVGSLSASVADPTPEPGSKVEITGNAYDAAGNPLANVDVTFAITSNPGEASFANGGQSIVAATDANGVARAVLNTGSVPGTIVVRVEAAGVVSQVTMSTGAPQALPRTGGQVGHGGQSSPFLMGSLVLGLALLLSSAAIVAQGRRKKATA